MILRDGSEARDPRYDRLIQFDDDSRLEEYSLMGDIPKNLELRSKNWWEDDYPHLEQIMGSCTGHGAAHTLIAMLRNKKINHTTAVHYYWLAQHFDVWAGGSYADGKAMVEPWGEGSSVLAICKALVMFGLIKGFKWTFNVNKMGMGIAHHGPATIGTVWTEGCYYPDSDGFIHPQEGEIVGGHCTSVQHVAVIDGEIDHFGIKNSHSRKELLKISRDDMAWLLDKKRYAEAVFFILPDREYPL